MTHLFLTLVIFGFLFLGLPRTTYEVCTKTSVESLISYVNTYVSSISTVNPNYDSVETQLDNFLNNVTYQDCMTLLDSMLDIKSTRFETIITNECRETNKSSSGYIDNPCCNSKLLEDSCCEVKTITEIQPVASVFKDTVSSCPTIDWPQTRSRVRNHFRVNHKRREVCSKVTERKLRRLEQALRKVRDCPNEIRKSNIPCKSSSDCYSGICLPDSVNYPTKYTCAPSSYALDKSDALSKCIRKYLPLAYLRFFQGVLSLSTTADITDSELINAFKTKASTNKCLNENASNANNLKVDSSIIDTLTTETECLNEKICSDGQNTCANSTSFCGALCGSNGICDSVISGIDSESQCSNTSLAIGTCINDKTYHSTIGLKTLVNMESCTSRSYCTVACEGCSEIDCQENTGTCFKFPFTESKCVLPYSKTESPFVFMTCPDGTVDVGFGCQSTDSISQCITKQGRWINVPSSQEACEKSTQNEDVVEIEQLYLTCNEGNNRLSSKYKTSCSSCGFQNELLFNWEMGRYVSGKWTKQSTWTARTLKSKYRWTQVLNSTTYSEKIDQLEKILKNHILQSYVQCSISPTLSNIKQISCSCEGSSGCFTDEGAIIGEISAFPGVEEIVDLKDAIVTIKSNSISTGNPTLTFKRVPLYMERTELQFTSTPVEITIQSLTGDVVGYVVGNGITVPYSSSQGIEVCIQKDSQFYSTFDRPGFAKKDSQGRFVKDNSITIIPTSNTAVICGLVKSEGTYYPIFTEATYIDPSSATTHFVKFSTYLFILLFAIMMLL